MKQCPACKYAAPAGVSPFSAAFHRAHRDAHLAAFPNSDANTRANLELMVTYAERGAFAAPVELH